MALPANLDELTLEQLDELNTTMNSQRDVLTVEHRTLTKHINARRDKENHKKLVNGLSKDQAKGLMDELHQTLQPEPADTGDAPVNGGK